MIWDKFSAWFSSAPDYIHSGIQLLAIAAVALLALVVARRVLLRILRRLAARTPTRWDETLLDQKVFDILAWALPLLVLYQGLQFVINLPAGLTEFLQRLTSALMVLVVARSVSALLNGVNVIYNGYPVAQHRPIKGYLQVGQIIVYLVGGVFIVAILINQSPWYFLSGLGAMMAIVLLVFRDTLLSMVAGIQLVNNDLLRIGDWVEMPEFGADGDVIDIALHVVKIQNWDRTITMIPTHKFLDHSFKNWRGMTESGGRRIMRSINLDMATIRFLSEAEEERFGRFALLKDYMEAKRREIADYNRTQAPEPGLEGVGALRRLTNIGTLRAYIVSYLRRHPKIHQEMTFIVRQLASTPEGLPIQVYVFTNDTNWINYEGIQSDIFDHLLAVVPEFGLRVYQRPSGYNIANTFARDGARMID